MKVNLETKRGKTFANDLGNISLIKRDVLFSVGLFVRRILKGDHLIRNWGTEENIEDGLCALFRLYSSSLPRDPGGRDGLIIAKKSRNTLVSLGC